MHSHLAGVLAGAAAVLGNWRPLFLGFKRGGKIVATTGGAFLGFAPIVGGIGAGVWLLVFLTTRYVSLASMIAGLSMPALAAVLGYPWPVIVFAGAAAAGSSSSTGRTSPGSLHRHRSRLRRCRAAKFSSGAIVRPRRLSPFQ